MLSLRSESSRSRSLSLQPSSNSFVLTSHGPRKKIIGGATSKGKARATTGGTTSKRINNQPVQRAPPPPRHRSRLSALSLLNKKTSC